MISKQLSQLYEVKPLSKIVEKKCYYNSKTLENISNSDIIVAITGGTIWMLI